MSGRSEVVIAGDLQCYSQNADAAWETRLPLEEHGWYGWEIFVCKIGGAVSPTPRRCQSCCYVARTPPPPPGAHLFRVDGWDLDSGERSATFDAGHNAMAKTLTQAAPETALRLDRILVRSDRYG